MYRKAESVASPAEKFELPNGCKLAEDNRWVIMAKLIPWSEFEEEYAQNFGTEMGRPAKSFRLALAALIITLFCHSPGRQSPEALSVNQYKLSY
jgi:hypothetical protein